MTWLLLVLLLVLVAAVGVRSYRRSQDAREQAEADLATARRAVDEDVTVLGEELQLLDADLPDRSPDDSTRADHQRALDAYEAAKESAAAMRSAEDARHVVEILDDGRYAIACVRARVAGEPVPARRPACFFDPRHGPSVTDVSWAPPGGVERSVPACGPDAGRVAVGAEPHTRQVLSGSRRVPYWEAGPALSPMAAGYFGSFGMLSTLYLGTTMGMMMGYGGGFDGGGFGADHAGGEASGGFDGGFDGGF